LSPFPYYKAGQFLFDLLEWEDFMLDGPEPPIVPTVLDAASLGRLAQWLDELRSALVLIAADEAGETKSSGDSG